MTLNKASLNTAVENLRRKADECEEEARKARYRNDKCDAQYHEGMRIGYLRAALDIEVATGA